MATIYIENKAYEADAKQNLLHASLSLGFDLPYFCWHPALGSVGACRQCAVKQFKDENDTRGRLVMACMTPASDGARISIADQEAYEFRKAVIQGLMLNHPHDCPVCDEGGECHLQDMTVMAGHRERSYNFEKRTFRNQYLGPLVNHEMNRCIQCQRCVRYYRDYAGGDDLNAFRLRDTVFFGRANDGVLENEFSGNLVEICPTGVFTDATLKRHYTRKWDLQMAPSVCVHCGVGCNISLGERYGEIRRVVNRYNSEVNSYFLCDRGRFAYEFLNSPDRVSEPHVDGVPASGEVALNRAQQAVADGRVIGIGSPRASVEANFALREMVGEENFFSGMPGSEHEAVQAIVRALTGPAACATLAEVEHADAAFVAGEDLTNTAPVMALRLRQAVRQKSFRKAETLGIPLWLDQAVREAAQEERSPLYVAAPYATKLDDIAVETWHAAPNDIARLAFAVAHEIDASAPAVDGLPEGAGNLARAIAQDLVAAERPLIVSGCGLLNAAVVDGSAQIAFALKGRGKDVRLAFAMPEANTMGLALLGARPLEEAFRMAAGGAVASAIVLENDLYRQAARAEVDHFTGAISQLIVLDHVRTQTTDRAHVLLPAATYAESDGTVINNEGRAQRFFEVVPPKGAVQASWRWIRDVAQETRAGSRCEWQTLDDVIEAMARRLPLLAPVHEAAPLHTKTKVPREPNRYSGRTSMLANISVHEPKPPEDPDSTLAFSMEATPGLTAPSMIPFFWAPGWNSIQATAKFQAEVGGALRGGDPGVRILLPDGAERSYLRDIPAAFRSAAQDLAAVPVWHIFGSEELSRLAPAIRELIQKPHAVINTHDARELGLREGEMIRLDTKGSDMSLPMRICPDVARGIIGVPAEITASLGTRTCRIALAKEPAAARARSIR